MYGVYEIITWDDVNYYKVAEFVTEEEAIKKMEELKKEREKKFVPNNTVPFDYVTYKVMSELEYSLLIASYM